MRKRINVVELFRGTGGAITQAGNIISGVICLDKEELEGFFSLQMINTGGTVTATLLVCSTLDGTFVAPNTPITIISAQAAGAGFASFKPPLAPFMKIKFTETDVAAVTAMDAWLNYQ